MEEVAQRKSLRPDAEEVLRLLAGRQTIRFYDSRPVPRNTVEKLLHCASWAPSAHNVQPWHFVVVETHAVKERLAQAMAARWEADLTADGVPKRLQEAHTGYSILRITSAPVLIIPCLDMTGMDQYPDERRQQAERVMGIQSVAAAIQNLLLAAHALGLGAAWLCAPLFCPDVVQDTLQLPSHLEPQALITVGYPDEREAQRNRKKRKSLAEITIYR